MDGTNFNLLEGKLKLLGTVCWKNCTTETLRKRDFLLSSAFAFSFFQNIQTAFFIFYRTALSFSKTHEKSTILIRLSSSTPHPSRFTITDPIHRPSHPSSKPSSVHPSFSPSTPRIITNPIPHPPHPSLKSNSIHPSSSLKLSAQLNKPSPTHVPSSNCYRLKPHR